MHITDLTPPAIWNYFYEITQIPRPSKKEEKIIAYLEQFAQKHCLPLKKDQIGNILISKAATSAAYENKPPVIIQSHLDMVCEKNEETLHNFEHDPIETYLEDGWVKAKGTTLGADDGIGIAAQLAVLASNHLEHGPIECLFTVDEETGLSGAKALQKGFMTGRILLNLDSEDEGELFIGCAGGIDSLAHFYASEESVPEKSFAFQIKVTGLIGGHSGDDINKSYANALRLLAEFLYGFSKQNRLQIVNIGGGNLRNAIPRESYVEAFIPFSKKEALRIALNEYIASVDAQFGATDAHIKISLSSCNLPLDKCWTEAATQQLLEAMLQIPNGVITMHSSIANLVETSSNLASVKMTKEDAQVRVEVCTSQRSASESEKMKYAQIIKNIFVQHHFEVEQSDGYPGWEPNTASPIAALVASCYKKIFDKEPEIKAIHAGLECGLFLCNYPQLDMVSFGPTLRGVHSPDERLEIASVDKFWKLLIEVLEQIA